MDVLLRVAFVDGLSHDPKLFTFVLFFTGVLISVPALPVSGQVIIPEGTRKPPHLQATRATFMDKEMVFLWLERLWFGS